MLELLLALLGAAESPVVTGYKISPLTLYDAQGSPIERLVTKDLPPPPLRVTDTNEFGYLQVAVKGRPVYVRPADVKHNLSYCAAGAAPVRRQEGDRLGASRPLGVRKGAGENDTICIPQ